MSKNINFFNIAIDTCFSSKNDTGSNYIHGSVIVSGGHVIGRGVNNTKSPNLIVNAYNNGDTIHSEMMCINDYLSCNKSKASLFRKNIPGYNWYIHSYMPLVLYNSYKQ